MRFKKPWPKAICVDDHAYIWVDSRGRPRKPLANERLLASLTIGKVYKLRGEDLGMWAILDDTRGVYLYPKNRFRLLRGQPKPRANSGPRGSWRSRRSPSRTAS